MWISRHDGEILSLTHYPVCLPDRQNPSTDQPALGGAVQAGIFISYRGEDTYSYAALLHLELSRHIGDDLVFLDSESIEAGQDFSQQIVAKVRSSRVMLVVIGRHWLNALDPRGGRGIDDPQDWIRRELVEAFSAGVRVIPILTDESVIPSSDQLPADIAALSVCQYRRLRHRDASADMRRIITELIDKEPSLVMHRRTMVGLRS